MKKILFISMVLVLSIKIHAQEITLIPDSIFEQVLIEKGIDTDGVVNGQILFLDNSGVDVNFLSEGLYVYRITDSTGRIQSGKLVKK